MGVELQRIVDYVNKNTKGLAAVDLARLNLRIGHPLSRRAMLIPDRPELVELGWRLAREIVDEGGRR